MLISAYINTCLTFQAVLWMNININNERKDIYNLD